MPLTQPFGYYEQDVLQRDALMKQKPRRKAKKLDSAEVSESFAPIVSAFAGDPDVKLGRMFSSSSVLNVNGKIFAMLVKGKLVVKLPGLRVEQLVSSGNGERFDPGHGRLMKEWVAANTDEQSWLSLAKEAYRFVKGDKPQKER